MTRGKLITPVTLKVDDRLREALDREQRARENETGIALSRSITIRLLLEESLGLRPSAKNTSGTDATVAAGARVS